MYKINIDDIIFFIFLLINLLIGLFGSRRVTNIKSYAVGDGDFSNLALIATIVATWISGSGFFITITKTYTDGLYYLLVSSGITLQLILMAYFLIPKMQDFLGKTSIGEVMGEFYGKEVRLIIAIASSLGACGLIAVQFKAFGSLFNYFYGIDKNTAIIVASVITIMYSALGGIRAVTMTDIVQFFSFIIAIPLVTLIIYYKTGANAKDLLYNSLHNETLFNLKKVNIFHMLALLLYFSVPGMGPVFVQRISLGRDIKQVKFSFLCAAIIIFLIKISIAFIAILVLNVKPDIEASNLIGYIINEYSVIGFKGLLIILVVAMAMSTADSYINSSAVVFTNDFCIPLKLCSNNALLISRIFAFILGILSLVLALYTTDMLNTVMFANSFYMPVATPPIILTILGIRFSKISVLAGMFAGFFTATVWYSFKLPTDGIVIAMLSNTLVLLAMNYLIFKNNGNNKAGFNKTN